MLQKGRELKAKPSMASINLKFRKPHRSIIELPETALPGFCIITGVNGSGKSHLLEAIETGSVEVQGLPHGQGAMRRYDWTSFAPQIEESANPARVREQREQELRNLTAIKNGVGPTLVGYFVQAGVSGDSHLSDKKFLNEAGEAALAPVLGNCQRRGTRIGSGAAVMLAKQFLAHRGATHNNFVQHLGRFGDLKRSIEQRATELGVSVFDLPDETYREYMPIDLATPNVLHFQFAGWFAGWHAAWEFNRIQRYYATVEGETNRHYLTDDIFRERFGPEPWDLTNRVLQIAGVRYRVNRPTFAYTAIEQSFNLRFCDPEENVEIQVKDLSSGEKVLLAIILLLYQTSGEMGVAPIPQLLLLDEVDAPLHPSYTKTLVDILKNELVGKCGLRVIMTTHAPSTVALASEGTVFELVRKPRQIRPISPGQATQILSSGFVSITPTDIIVITESSDDADYYQRVHASLVESGVLNSHPPLKFLAASKVGKDGQGGGCPQVTNWAQKLHGLGWDRFRGLIDRDSGNVGDDVVKVISRHSVENYLYDPLTVCAFLIHRGILPSFSTVKLSRLAAAELLSLSQSDLQKVVDGFFEWLAKEAGEPAIHTSSRIAVAYLKLPSIQIPNWWVETNGHQLEALLRKFLNPLSASQNRGALIKENRDEIIVFQTKTLPEVISRDLAAIFTELQKIA
ncbi:MAG TPA: AAA family ATPase [Verrucomicrobiae bacterium]|jgi:energy-coupling factor transporter ATP-binding protein EcfA2